MPEAEYVAKHIVFQPEAASPERHLSERTIQSHPLSSSSSIATTVIKISSTFASLPSPIRICIEVLSPECRELVKRVADRLGQRVENEAMTGFASYVLDRVTAAAEHDDDDDGCRRS